MYAIETMNLSKTYKGGVKALQGLDLKVKRGDSLGYLGPNGAGKTTTIQILLNLIRPTEGDAYLFGESIIGQERKVLKNIGALVEIPGFYEYLTPFQTLRHILKLYDTPRKEIRPKIKEILEIVQIDYVENKKIATFSTGMKRRLSIAQALVHDPELIILDEPTIGLDPKGVREMRDLIKQLNKDGTTIFLTSHNLTEVAEISDRVVFLKEGVKIKDENMGNLQKQMSSNLIDVKCLTPLTEQQKDIVNSIAGVSDLSDGIIEYEGGIDTAYAIMKEISNNDIPLYSFTPRAMTLEDLYLQLYKEESK